ncbi:MAG: helix-turn-helix transcriptional regulator [Bacteroidota bacterium]
MTVETNVDFVDMLASLNDQGMQVTFDGQWHHLESEVIRGKCTQRTFADEFEFRIWDLEIVQDVRMFRRGNVADRWFLTLMIGTAEIENRDEDYQAVTGNLSTMELHNLKKDDEFIIKSGSRLTSVSFHVNASVLKPFLKDTDEELGRILSDNPPLAMNELVDRLSRNALTQCITMDFGDEFGRRLLHNCMEFLFLFNLQKFWARLRGHFHLIADTDDLAYQRMLKASTLFGDYRNPPSLEVLSKFVGLNTMATNELFKQVYGKTPYQFFNDKRLNEAYQLISETDMRIADVGVMLGYGNMSHFSKAFKKHYGILPKQLQMQGA